MKLDMFVFVNNFYGVDLVIFYWFLVDLVYFDFFNEL